MSVWVERWGELEGPSQSVSELSLEGWGEGCDGGRTSKMCRQVGSTELGGKSHDAMVRSGYNAMGETTWPTCDAEQTVTSATSSYGSFTGHMAFQLGIKDFQSKSCDENDFGVNTNGTGRELRENPVSRGGEAVRLEEGGSGWRTLSSFQESTARGWDSTGRRRPGGARTCFSHALSTGCVREARARWLGSARRLWDSWGALAKGLAWDSCSEGEGLGEQAGIHCSFLPAWRLAAFPELDLRWPVYSLLGNSRIARSNWALSLAFFLLQSRDFVLAESALSIFSSTQLSHLGPASRVPAVSNLLSLLPVLLHCS